MSSVNQSITMAAGDPLTEALPPATDYLTYLTLLEYQLTPARLPTLHKLLQDEVLTTNIGWDLVKILLPMLPESQECLQDVARLGNPREVILRVSDALMHLHPVEEDNDLDSENELEKQLEEVKLGVNRRSASATGELPLHIIKFNTLLSMLSTLHARIQTKSPSRFLATSLQAALEAYTSMPTNETTLALLEFFRDVSPTKRPTPPPRAPSDSTVLRVAEASAPDPEAEATTPSPAGDNEAQLIKRFLQFGLIELLKSYLLSSSGPMDPGLSWAIRLQEKLYPDTRMPGTGSPTNVYTENKQLGERDGIVAKITALSQDLGLTDAELLKFVSLDPETQPPPLDFEDHPKRAEDIPLERHGAVLLLAARAAASQLFSSGKSSPIPVYPDLARVFHNFVGRFPTLDEVAFEQPQVLLDGLLALAVLSLKNPVSTPSTEKEFTDFVISLTACTVRQTYSTVRRIPGTVNHSNPSEIARFKVIRKVLEDDHYRTIKDRAIDWLKNEILEAAMEAAKEPSNSESIFLNPHYFSVLFPLLFASPSPDLDSSDLVTSFVQFTQALSPAIHSALNLYYVLISSSTLRTQLQLEKTYVFFRNRFLQPLKSICGAFTADLPENGGDGKIPNAVGEDMMQIGIARSVNLVTHIADQVEDVVTEAFVVGDEELQEPSADDIARVDAIRKETSVN
ncbi:YAP-binding/ALF4/Glomulin [Aspergillus crustosus]